MTRRVPPGSPSSRFELAPPRHFLLPALLLLVAEAPSHGYELAKKLADLHFGRADGPAVYRALRRLEADGLVEVWSEAPVAGSMRKVYGATVEGERVLRGWMGVIREERDALDGVLRRYAGDATLDAVLAQADSRANVRARPVRALPVAPPPATGRCRYRLRPERSAVLIEARSTVGPIAFGALGLAGSVELDVADGRLAAGTRPSAHVDVPVVSLRSGNRLYDTELLRRIDVRRFPVVALDLDGGVALGTHGRFRISGSATIHGVTRPMDGTVVVNLEGESLAVTGEHDFDIRDFGIESPSLLMLRIHPEVTVRLQVEADLECIEEEVPA